MILTTSLVHSIFIIIIIPFPPGRHKYQLPINSSYHRRQLNLLDKTIQMGNFKTLTTMAYLRNRNRTLQLLLEFHIHSLEFHPVFLQHHL